METIDVIGYLAAVLGTICWLPQTIKAWRSKETKDLSLGTNVLVLVTMLLWLAYGVLAGSLPLITANVLSVGMVSAILVAKFRYG